MLCLSRMNHLKLVSPPWNLGLAWVSFEDFLNADSRTAMADSRLLPLHVFAYASCLTPHLTSEHVVLQ